MAEPLLDAANLRKVYRLRTGLFARKEIAPHARKWDEEESFPTALIPKLADEFEKLKDMERAARALERGLEAEPSNADLRKRLRSYYESAKAWVSRSSR